MAAHETPFQQSMKDHICCLFLPENTRDLRYHGRSAGRGRQVNGLMVMLVDCSLWVGSTHLDQLDVTAASSDMTSGFPSMCRKWQDTIATGSNTRPKQVRFDFGSRFLVLYP